MRIRLLSYLLVLHLALSTIVSIANEFNSQSFSDPDAASWTIGGASPPTTNFMTTCGTDRIFGGSWVFHGDSNFNSTSLTKTYTSLPPHYSFRLQMKIYKLDSWNNERLSVLIDDVESVAYTWDSTFGSSDTCGTLNPTADSSNPSYNDGYVFYDYNQTHSATSLKIKIVADLDEVSGESWGIRDLKLELDLCSPECLTCNNSVSCLSCPTTTGLVATSLGTGYSTCVCGGGTLPQKNLACTSSTCILCKSGSCDTGYYSDGSACQTCATGCSTCTGSTLSSTDCSACGPKYYLNSSNPASVCLACDTTCYTCSGPASTQCTSCTNGYLLSGNTCVSTCPASTYGIQINHACYSCTSFCDSCLSSGSNDCVTCTSGYYLLNGACVTDCPSGYLSDGTTCIAECPTGQYDNGGVCTACTSHCVQCTASECLTCDTGYQLESSACQSVCSGATYFQPSSSTCADCFGACSACYNYTENSCTACNSGYSLANSSCTSACLDGTYSDAVTQSCMACHATCLTCTDGTITGCSACATGLYYDLNITQCLTQCDASTQAISRSTLTCWTCLALYQPYGDLCIFCHFSCATCSGSAFDDCVTCPSTRTQLPTFGICECSSGYYQVMATSCDTSSLLQGHWSAIGYLLVFTITIDLIMEIVFKHTTIFLPMIQGLQAISLCYFIDTPYPYGLDDILFKLLQTHVSRLLPSLFYLKYQYRTKGRLAQGGIKSFFAQDGQQVTLGFLILFLLLGLTRLISKITPRRAKSVRNSSAWLDEKLVCLLRVWFKLTSLYIGLLVACNYKNFQWGTEGDFVSLLVVALPAIVCGTVVSYTTEYKQSAAGQQQYFWVISSEYEYTPNAQSKPKEINEKFNASDAFLYVTEQTEKPSKAEPQVSHNNNNNSFQTKDFHDNKSIMMSQNSPTKSKPEEALAAQNDQEAEEEKKKKQPYSIPMFNYLLRIALGASLIVLNDSKQVQAMTNLILTGLILGGTLACRFKRKIYKLFSWLWAIGVFINAILVFCFVQLSEPIFANVSSLLMILLVLASMLLSLGQLVVNLPMIPNIFRMTPLKIESILNKHINEDDQEEAKETVVQGLSENL